MLGLATLAGFECGLIGPFGSYPANPLNRLIYWTALFWSGAVLLWPTLLVALSVGPRRGYPPLFSGVVATLLSCVPLAAVAAVGCQLLWPVHASGIRNLEWYGLTLLVALPATAGILWLGKSWTGVRGRARDAPLADEAAERDTGVPARTSPACPPQLLELALCLRMEDHHVRVHTQGRSYLHLAPLRDVVEALGDRGLQVHRSWWVSRSAVAGWTEAGRSVALVLRNGMRVPVSRSRLPILRAQGWLEGSPGV